MRNGLKTYLNEVFKKYVMPFDPNSAKKAGKKSKRGPKKKKDLTDCTQFYIHSY